MDLTVRAIAASIMLERCSLLLILRDLLTIMVFCVSFFEDVRLWFEEYPSAALLP